MRKIILSISLLLGALSIQASAVDATASYIYSSDHNQARVGAAVPIGLNVRVGVEGKYVEDKLSLQEGGLKDPVYSVYLPIQLDLDMAKLDITPFYYFKNKSHQALFQDASAYGVAAQLRMDLLKDEVEELYSQAFVGVSYARQQGSVQEASAWHNEDYDQLAFTLGLRQNFYGAFVFQASGTAFAYPDGISRVENFRGVLDQKDLGFTQSFDVNRALGKYTLAARITRVWEEKRSSLYVGYHYAEAYTADPEHSALLGNTFYIARQAYVDIAYNHLQNTDGKNKRDLFYICLNIAF